MKRLQLMAAAILISMTPAMAYHGKMPHETWKGDFDNITTVTGALEVPLIAIPEEYWLVDATTKPVSATQVHTPVSKGTLWCSFIASKDDGKGRFGITLCNGATERLFVPVESAKPCLTVVRIDYDAGKAYLYHNISPASIPDLENAEETITGDFSFDKLNIVADKGCSGKIAALSVSDDYHETVAPRTLADLRDKGTFQRATGWQKENNALWIHTDGEGSLYLRPYESGGIRVMFGTKDGILSKESFAVTEEPTVAEFTVTEDSANIILSASSLTATVNKEAGYITYTDPHGRLLVKEFPGKARKNIVNDSVNAYCAFSLTPSEAVYGLGQFRDGRMNLRNCKRELVQFNTQAAVPVLFSTAGWGIFWNNPSRTVYIDNADGLQFVSDYGKVVDYYLFTGGSLDSLIGAYRRLTGEMPMLPYWAFGFHQSRNRYHTGKEVIDVVHRMHEEHTPLSTIFIDYHHWGKYGTGSFRFDEAYFPDMDKTLDSLHRTYNARVVLTVWPSFKVGTPGFNDMSAKGYLLDGAMALDGMVYDPFNPDAAARYSEKFSELLKYDIDGWFLDGPEPDQVGPFLSTHTYLGPAHRVRNLYPLFHSMNFYRNLTAARPGVRPYMLTRCAWAGQQKYGTAVWSGDIPATFEELAIQVAAGLNFTASGIPYWTTDIGGYSGGDVTDSNYRELFTRWFQYGTFCPVFRSHGRRYPGDTKAPNELWSYGEQTQRICTDFVNLRYRLLPYIYSLSGKVTHDHYTPMRLLAFDYPSDGNVLDCKDQFMFGTAFLVCPVLEAGATARKVYLPEGNGWIDYWTNRTLPGGSTLNADAPVGKIPLYIKAGAIIPCHATPETEPNPDTPLEIHIYAGMDGDFDLYDDDGDSMDYTSGEYRKVSLHWADNEQTLHISSAQGDFKPAPRRWIIRLKGLDGNGDKIKRITYNGKKHRITF